VDDVQLEFTENNLFSFFTRGKTANQPLIDISAEGLQFLSDKKLSEGTELKITLKIPATSRSVDIKGQVRWIQQVQGQELFRTGIMFTAMAPDIGELLGSYINEQGEQSSRVLCNSCGAPFLAKRKMHGKKVKCPKCGQAISIETEKPKADVARKSVHVSAPGSTDDEEVKRLVGIRVFIFLKQNIRSRLHLALVEHMTSASSSTRIFTPKDLASALGKRDTEIMEVLKDFTRQGLVREVGKYTYNFGPSKAVRETINELRRLNMKQNVRSAILSFVFAQEKK